MMTGEQYKASLADGRLTYFQGRQVEDVYAEARFRQAVEWVAATYDRFFDPSPQARSPLFEVPHSSEDLRARVPLLRETDIIAQTTFQSLLALLTAAPAVGQADTSYVDRIKAYYEDVVAQDRRLVECITDGKGNRTLAPSQQADPDAYVHVVKRSPEGIVIRGAKLHITGASFAHDLVIMPTKQMKQGEEDYAVACAVPLVADGVHVVNTTYAPPVGQEADYPFSSRESMPDGFVILDDVFVPYEQVFLDGEVQYSANFAHSLGLWERLGGTSFMADEADILVGLAQLVAEANGLGSVPHVREKINGMIIYATIIRAGLEAALHNVGHTSDGMVYPSEIYTNTAKFYGAANYDRIVRDLHDIAGGAVVTAPSLADLDHEVVGPWLRKYLSTGPDMPGEERARIMHAIRDFTADSFGGWRSVTNIQSGGGLYAQQLVTRKHYDLRRAKEMARRAAGLDKEG